MSDRGRSYSLHTLGSLQIRAIPDEGVVDLTGQPALVFAYLVDRGAPVARSELSTLFWPDADASRGRHGLRQVLSRIRSSLDPDIIVGTDPVGIDTSRVLVDARAFAQALEAGDLERALGLWGGPFLSEAANGYSWEVAEWMELRRRELEAMLLDRGRGAVRALMGADEFESALALVTRLQERLPRTPALAMDAAELLLEAGRPNEAAVQLERAEVPIDDPRAAAILRRMAKTVPEGTAPGGLPVPAEVGRVPDGPEPVVAPEAQRSARHRSFTRGAAVFAGAAIVLIALIGFLRPAPLAPAAVWFCSVRETHTAFRLDLPGKSLEAVRADPGCPVLPIGTSGDSALVLTGTPEVGATLVLEVGGVPVRTVLEADWAFPALPLRQAGAQDGVISPDGHWVVMTIEVPRSGGLPLVTPLPGVAGSRADPEMNWTVVMASITTGEVRSIGRADARTWDGRFTPDGEAVVYVSDETGGGDLYRYQIATGARTRLTSDARLERVPVVGRTRTVYMVGAGTDDDPEQVAVLDHATGEVRYPWPGDWNHGGPDLSVDERRVCWTTKEDGHWESDILVARADGRGRVRQLGGAGRDGYCQWVGSRHVLFRSWQTGNQELFLQGLAWWGRAENISRHVGADEGPFVVGG